MLCLVFHLGPDRFGLPVREIARVLPLLEFKQIPGAPSYVAGLANYHGRPIPVLDLSMLATGTPASERLDTRLVLVHYLAPQPQLLGLVAERVAGVEPIDADALCEDGIDTSDKAPWLGKLASANGMLQLVTVNDLLPPAVRALLFPVREHPC